MPRKKKEDTVVENTVVEKVANADAPAKKTRKPRAKKAETALAAEKPARKPRSPRKKAIVPNFVIQNSADNSITYTSVVEKVQAAISTQDVKSLDIYVKAEDGKQSVGQYLAQVGKANDANLSIKRFVRFETGEGIEKREENFAEEVAKQAGMQ